jgi:hypothetical protein
MSLCTVCALIDSSIFGLNGFAVVADPKLIALFWRFCDVAFTVQVVFAP